MKDKNFAKYAPYLDPDAEGFKLKKNAPASAKKAFAEAQAADRFADGEGYGNVADIIGMLMEKDKKKNK